MTKKIFFFIALLPVFVIACNSNDDASKSTSDDNQVETKKAKPTTAIESPCEFISEAKVRSMFMVPDSLSIEMKDRVLTYPTCSFEWLDGKVIKIMQVGSNEVKINMPSEVMVVMVKDAGESMYNRSVQVYKDIEKVDNVGDMASWGTKMAQLSFVAKGYMFHVHVKASDDDAANKAKAIQLSKLIIDQL